MSHLNRLRYPTASELGLKLMDAFIVAGDFEKAAQLRDELDADDQAQRRAKSDKKALQKSRNGLT